MKKIEVNHTPDFMHGFAIAVSFLWILMTIVFAYTFEYAITLMLSIGLFLTVIALAFFIDCKKTIVEYDTQTIRWKWLWLTYTVNLNDMESVHYTITSERTRYGYNRHFEIVFKVKDDELRLNDRLETEDIENSINGTPDNIKLMQLYKFIESICPTNSKGFIKTDPEIF